MKSHVSTAALALLLLAGTALAQDRQPQGQQGGAGAERSGGQAAPGAGQGGRGGGGEAQRGEGRGQSDGREAPSRGGAADRAGEGQSAGDRGKEQRRTTTETREKNEQTTPQRQQSSDREKTQRNRAQTNDGKADAKERAASERAKAQQEQKAQQQQGSSQRRGDAQPSRDRAGEGAGAGQAGQAQQGEGQAGRGQGQAGQTDRERNARGADPSRSGAANRGARERAEISDTQRERVRTVIREQRPRRAANINVDIDIGRRLPRTVELRPLPRRVVEIVPAYRSYRYVYVDDRIVIVDPGTYEVVYVIDEEPNRGRVQRSARAGSGNQVQLELTQSERQVLFQFVEYDRARADIQFRLGLGAEVPRDVELFEFPVEVLDRVRKLEPYRYVVVDRTVLVVDPGDRQIELVVEPR